MNKLGPLKLRFEFYWPVVLEFPILAVSFLVIGIRNTQNTFSSDLLSNGILEFAKPSLTVAHLLHYCHDEKGGEMK